MSDYNGLPQGALDVADNVEIRYRNVLEPRRGFEQLEDSDMTDLYLKRLTNFYVEGEARIIGLNSDGDLVYYDGSDPWPDLPGDVVTGLIAPDSTNAKCRFVSAGQNLYVTSQDGVRSYSSGSDAEVIRAGVPKGLNLAGETNGDEDGFLDYNLVLATTGNITASSSLITNLADTTGIAVGQYVTATDDSIPEGTKVASIDEEATALVETGNTTAGSTSLTNLTSLSGVTAGVIISGTGIQEGTLVVSTSGAGPYTVTMDTAAYQTATGSTITFTSPAVIHLDDDATDTLSDTSISFYTGSQVAYRMVFGRVETDINGSTITRLGSPSAQALVTSTVGHSTNVEVTGTIPKNASSQITFVQLYRSGQTSSTSITPLEQYNLVYEAELTDSDFTNRTITITDDVSDSLVGASLYTGDDQEGSTQANDPPPMCWDMCKFRDFNIYGNVTYPTSMDFTIVSVGSPSGIQSGDEINVSGSFSGISFSETYTAATGEDAANRKFEVVTSGTASQNIADTADSLIRVINYDEDLPVHAILLSSSTDLPGQIYLEADYPSYDTFFVNASAHTSAYDPELSHVESDLNSYNNAIAVSKSGELEAVPATNQFTAGDTSSDLLRVVPLRDYVVVLKTDGIYKIQGITPSGLVVNPFDLTTKIIGADTAVSLNSGVWMLSNQGVVSISDGGVDAKSVPIDNQLNTLIGTYLDNLTQNSFAVGYESDRKYILCVPSGENAYAEIEYNFNYVTSAWTTWSRNFYSGFIHSTDNVLYFSRSDANNQGVCRERKTATYKDYVDEAVSSTIISVDGSTITLDNVEDVDEGDILYQSTTLFSPILSVDLENSTVEVQYELSFTAGSVDILKAYLCEVTWKQVFGDNPAFMRQFSEGVALFKNTRFNEATAKFVTDFSQNVEEVTLEGTGNGLWGLFAWGEIPWGGVTYPSKIRFLVPQSKQIGSYILPTIEIQQGYSDFKLIGLSITFYNISQEDGR